MNRINQTIKKNQKKTKSDQKEIPTFGVDGNVIIPGKKERQKKIKKVIIIAVINLYKLKKCSYCFFIIL